MDQEGQWGLGLGLRAGPGYPCGDGSLETFVSKGPHPLCGNGEGMRREMAFDPSESWSWNSPGEVLQTSETLGLNANPRR